MAFARVEIEACPGFGFEVAPEFQTNIQNIQSGREKRNGDWGIVRHRFSVPYLNISLEQYRNIKEVFYPMRGRLNTFMQKDWTDYQAEEELFGVGDSAEDTFQLRKVSTKDGLTYERVITKIAAGIQIFVNGVLEPDVDVDLDTGEVVFDDPPGSGALLTWTGEFFVHVRFDTDSLPFNYANLNAMVGTLDLLEVLDE